MEIVVTSAADMKTAIEHALSTQGSVTVSLDSISADSRQRKHGGGKFNTSRKDGDSKLSKGP